MAIVSAIILASGALFGIWLGAFYAAGRLGAQLDEQRRWFEERSEADVRRMEDELKAESERLGYQLAHDRQMRDRDALRQCLDEGAILISNAVNTLHRIRAEAEQILDRIAKNQSYEDLVAERDETFKRWTDAISDLHDYWQRLLVRVNVDEPLAKAFAVTLSQLGELGDVYWTNRLSSQLHPTFKRGMDTLAEMHTDFLSECRQQVGIET